MRRWQNYSEAAPVMKLLSSSSLSVQDQRELFVSAGYEDVKVIEEKAKGWICAVGQKPASDSQRTNATPLDQN
jgi:hypothetical protein